MSGFFYIFCVAEKLFLLHGSAIKSFFISEKFQVSSVNFPSLLDFFRLLKFKFIIF